MASPARDLGEFLFEGEVGRGTSGVVHRAREIATGQRVALKLLHLHAHPERQLSEAQLLGQLAHPAIVRILGSGFSAEGRPFIAMEWLDGEDLSQRQLREPLALMEALRLIGQVADALATAHDQGIIHRDVKPANIFLAQRPEHDEPVPTVLDFGAAMQVEAATSNEAQIIGTPAYMSPEQVRGDLRVTDRTDVYSLGATLYELLAGHPPHVGPSYLATLARLATTPARRLVELEPSTPPLLDALVHRMLATSSQDRPSMRQVHDELDAIISVVTRGSVFDVEPTSLHLGSSASRLLTTLVASRFPDQAARDSALSHVQALGTEAVPLGQDALVAHFGARRAHGNEAQSALRIGRRLARSGAAVGVATGRAFVPMVELTKPIRAIGEVVDRATALSRFANAAQVLTDHTTRELGRELYVFVPRGLDVAEVGDPKGRSRLPTEAKTPFVGRQLELGRISTAFERAVKDPRAVVVSISGTPGIGKTRLQREAVRQLTEQHRFSEHGRVRHTLQQRSEPYGMKRALGVAIDLLRMLLGVRKGAEPADAEITIRERVEAALDERLQTRIPLFARLLAEQQLPTDEEARGLRDVLWLFMTRSFEHELAGGPIVVVAEDLQWADPESVQWLDHLLGRAARLPLFLVATCRHEFWTVHAQSFSDRDHVHIELHPISSEGTREITVNAGAGQLSEDAVESIVLKAGGSPLFAEELARLAIVGASVTQAPTIEAAIQVTLDALSSEQREALGRMSVLGQTGWVEALEALGLEDAEALLTELSQVGLLVPQEGSRFADMMEWQFKHGLVRDVVYQNLIEGHRQQLHASAARWLAHKAEDPTVIARHFELAGETKEAAEFWELAAQRALGTNALSDALNMAERALGGAQSKPVAFARARLLDEAWSRLDARASDRESSVSALEENIHDEASETYALGARARYDAARGQGLDVDERLARARDAAEKLGLTDEEMRCSSELAARMAFAGNFDTAEREAARLLTLAHERTLPAAAVQAWQTLAIVHQTKGELSAALTARRNAARAARDAELRERESVLTTNLGFALTTLGARDESLALLFDGLDLAEAIGSAGARRHAQMLLLGWSASFGSNQELDAILKEVRYEADAAAAGTWTAPARENLGVLFYRGLELFNHHNKKYAERARALLRLSAEAYRHTDNRDVLPVALGAWARAELLCDNVAEALQLAQSAAELLDSGAPSLLNESPVYLALHDCHLRQGHLELARAAVERAMPSLLRRIRGLAPTHYARPFLTALNDNSTLVSMAASYGVLPAEVNDALTSPGTH